MKHPDSRVIETQSNRTVRAFLLSPLGAAAVLTLWVALRDVTRTGSVRFGDFLGTAVLFTFFSYVGTLIVGAPMFFLFRRLGWTSRIACAKGGGISALLFITALTAPDVIKHGLLDTLAEYGSVMMGSVVAGVVAGLLFALFQRRAT
jgi:hypothetical protein